MLNVTTTWISDNILNFTWIIGKWKMNIKKVRYLKSKAVRVFWNAKTLSVKETTIYLQLVGKVPNPKNNKFQNVNPKQIALAYVAGKSQITPPSPPPSPPRILNSYIYLFMWREAQYWCHFPVRVKAMLPTFFRNQSFCWMVLPYRIRKTL